MIIAKAVARELLDHLRRTSVCSVRPLSLEALSILKKLGPKRRSVSPRKIEKKEKQLSRKGRWEVVKAVVAARAKGICECGCGYALATFDAPGGDPDHFYGKRHETVETIWQLNRWCHQRKTENLPNRCFWDERFAAHCRVYGYHFRPRLTKSLPSASPTVKSNPPGIRWVGRGISTAAARRAFRRNP